MTNQQAPEIYALHTVPNKGERPWSGIYAVRADAEHDAKVLRDATGRDWSVVRLVVADTATTPTGPVARYKISYATDDWGMRSSTPSGIPDDAGAWVRYDDHAAALCRLHAENEALRAQQPAPATQQAGEVSESIEQLAVARYKVVPAHESMFHRWAVVAGDGAQQLYLGREVECENMARKFAGAFLDGAFVAMQNAAPQPSPTAQADSQPAPEYVGNGMFKGETIEKAAEHWANWCDRRCMTGLSEFLRVVAARAPADSVLEDAARLDWLDQQCEAYGFQDIHEGNRWEISGAYANVREAIDAERAARKQGGE